jgi:8-hydroxy-5-deazaflavin:NADPH oxidoreductase
MKIGILGTGTLATALGTVWASAGHDVAIAGRSPAKAAALADRIGAKARATTPREAVTGRDAVLLAVAWAGVADILDSAGAGEGSLNATALIDPSNAVEHGVGVLLTADGRSAAQRIGELAPGAQVVKAFHLFAADTWHAPADGNGESVTVAICGDDQAALDTVAALVRDAGGKPAVLGSLKRSRQLEEVAGFVIGLAFKGVDPRSAVPQVTV